jgi:hypothetical protein
MPEKRKKIKVFSDENISIERLIPIILNNVVVNNGSMIFDYWRGYFGIAKHG